MERTASVYSVYGFTVEIPINIPGVYVVKCIQFKKYMFKNSCKFNLDTVYRPFKYTCACSVYLRLSIYKAEVVYS